MRYAWLLLVLRPLVQTREFKSTLGFFVAGCFLSPCSLTADQHENSDLKLEPGGPLKLWMQAVGPAQSEDGDADSNRTFCRLLMFGFKD